MYLFVCLGVQVGTVAHLFFLQEICGASWCGTLKGSGERGCGTECGNKTCKQTHGVSKDSVKLHPGLWINPKKTGEGVWGGFWIVFLCAAKLFSFYAQQK